MTLTFKVNSLAAIEIFASKIVALLTRTAPRDLYDINNMVYFGLFDETELSEVPPIVKTRS